MDEVTILTRKRGSIKAQATRLESFMKTVSTTDSIELQSKLDLVKNLKSNSEEIKFKFYEILEDDELASEEEEFLQIEERLQILEVSLKRCLYNISKASVTTENSANNFKDNVNTRLPEIPLPQFSGNYEDWSLFKARFNSLISSNVQLSDLQKLYYLQGSLISDAKKIQSADDTFESLMKTLEERYENKRLIVDTHINALLSLNKVNQESSKELRSLLDSVLKHIRALKIMKLETNKLSEVMIINIVLKKLDHESQKMFEMSLQSTELPDLENFVTFLQGRCQILEGLQRNKNQFPVRSSVCSGKSKSFVTKSSPTIKGCPLCKLDHSIHKCQKFHDLSVSERYKTVKKLGLCFNCLSISHRILLCKAKGCHICYKKHHSLLHFNVSSNPEALVSSEHSRIHEPTNDVVEICHTEQAADLTVANHSAYTQVSNYVLLSTAIVYVTDIRNCLQPCRVLLDNCSQSCFITVECATRLGIKRQKVRVPVSGINGSITTVTQKLHTVISASRDDFNCSLDMLVVPKITGLTPSIVIDTSKLNIPSYVHLADPEFDKPGKIFDPLGLVGPVITQAKMFMQGLWLLNLDWDDNLPEKETQDWIKFVTGLNSLTNLRIQRRIVSDRTVKIELHGFADASGRAYGAVVYLKCLSDSNNFTSSLLCSKSRVAPIKSITIPRLELNAAVLLSRLITQVIRALQINIDEVFLWSDSTITLAWINTSPHLLKTFVSNRVSTIQTMTAKYQWGHIRSEHNPADLISRGLCPLKMLNNEIWWYGPPQLMQQHISQNPVEFSSDEEAFFREIKENPVKAFVGVTNEPWIEDVIHKSSNYMKIVRIVAYVLRFCYNMKNAVNKKRGPLSKEEVNDATTKIMQHIQSEEFKEDITNLRKNDKVHVKSKLKTLHPFLDNDGLLRVGGRLSNAHIAYDKKHQVILPAKHRLTKLIFEHFHLKNMHVGAQTLLYTVRQLFWPINGRCIARKIVYECITCFRSQPTSVEQLMGDLPPERVTQNTPFNVCGVDFCGHFYIKYKGQRTGAMHKIYVAIFICFVTKAIHLEIVSDLTSEAFIAALKRFFARRGKSSNIFCDNATNFVGAHSELRRLHELVKTPDGSLSHFFSSEGISWKFLPPGAPNFGGLWEAGVKSFKHHLKRTIGTSRLTYEEFVTITTQIEGVLNSRPLTPLSNDPNDSEALTPGHFLIGRPINSPVEPELIDLKDNRLSRWQRTSKYVQLIWKRWQLDYLNNLQQRTKWYFTKKNVSKDMLVLVKEENLPTCKWLLGRIEEVVYGADGKVRVVIVNTKKGRIKRCVSKICLLPSKDNNEFC